jgi:hypothetical protein
LLYPLPAILRISCSCAICRAHVKELRGTDFDRSLDLSHKSDLFLARLPVDLPGMHYHWFIVSTSFLAFFLFAILSPVN